MIKNMGLGKQLLAFFLAALLLALCGCTNGDATQTPGGEQSYIGEDAAKQVALKHSGLHADQVERIFVELDSEVTPVSYVVDFNSGGYTYVYRIHAVSGEILNHEMKPVDPQCNHPTVTAPTVPGAVYMSSQDALAAALDHAGADQEQIRLLGVTLDEADEDRVHYDCAFLFDTFTYRYEIHAVTGEVLAFEVEEQGEDAVPTAPVNTQPPAAQVIDQDAALEVALNHQKAPRQEVEVISLALHDGETGEVYGGSYYEIAFEWDGFRYEYHVDGISGDVLTYDVTEIFGDNGNPDPGEDSDDDIYDDSDDFFGEDDDPFVDDDFQGGVGDFEDEPGEGFDDGNFDE